MQSQGLSVGQAILIFIAFFIVLIVVSLIKKLYYWIRYRKRFYIIPRVSVKGISVIAMVISISIVIIMLITIASADLMSVVFRAWPGTRVTIEGILIKIGGLLFGPFIGMFIGGMTDLLTVALTAGVFHYGYLIASMAYGLIGGMIRSIFNFSRKRYSIFGLYGTIFTIVIAAAIGLFLHFGLTENVLNVSMFGFDLDIPKSLMIGLIVGFMLSSVIVIWLAYVVQKVQLKKNPKSNWFSVFAPTLVAVLLCEVVVNILMMPSFDTQLTTLSYVQWVTIRSLLLIPMVIINMVIIYPIFKVVVPLVNYDYSKDLVESSKVPIYVN